MYTSDCSSCHTCSGCMNMAPNYISSSYHLPIQQYMNMEALYRPVSESISYSSSSLDNPISGIYSNRFERQLSEYSSYAHNYSLPNRTITLPVIHEPLLANSRPLTRFIDCFSDVKTFVEEAFESLMNRSLPSDILISIVSPEKMRKNNRHNSIEQLLGFAINRKWMNDFSSIFIKEDFLDKMMLTIGHEIGHVLSLPKEDPILEEAKAFAFELAWLKAIHDSDIAGLQENMNIRAIQPAFNGLHDVAFRLVQKYMSIGYKPIQIFNMIVEGNITS